MKNTKNVVETISLKGLVLFFLISCILHINTSYAQSTTTGSGLWSTSGNWSGSVPGNDNITGNVYMTLPMTLSGQSLQPKSSYTYYFKAALTSRPSDNTINVTKTNSAVDFSANAVISGTGTVMTIGTNGNENPPSRSLYIRSGASVTIIGNVLFEKSSGVLIEPGGELIIMGSLVNATLSNNVTVNGFLSATGSITNSSNGEVTGSGTVSAPTITNGGGSSSIFGITSSCGGNCSYSPEPPSCPGATATANSSQTICSGSSPNAFSATVSVPTSATGVSVLWQRFNNGVWQASSGTNNSFTSLGGGNLSSSYQSPSLTAPTAFRLLVTFTGCSNQQSNQLNMSIGTASPSGTIIISESSSLPCLNSATILNGTLSGISSYNWTVPSGINIISGQGTSVLTISILSGFVSSNQISVTGTNSCGTSAKSTGSITLGTGWIGSANSSWTNASNWCNGSLPTANTDILIPAGTTISITTTGAIVRNLSITGLLALQSGSTLSVTGNWLNNGTVNGTGSTLVLNGTTAQTIGGTTSIIGFSDITLANTNGVKLGSNQALSGTLTLGSNVSFTTTGYTLKLLSGPTSPSSIVGTARIAALPSGAGIVGSITLQRYVPGKNALRFISSPVQNPAISQLKNNIYITGSNAAAAGFDVSNYGMASLSWYVESIAGPVNYGWKSATDINKTLEVGAGYQLLIRGDRNQGSVNASTSAAAASSAVTIELAGTPNTGTISLPVSYTPSVISSTDGWNLVGNPYASEINWDAAGWTKTKISPSIWIWDPQTANTTLSSTTGGYFTYNPNVGCVPARANCGIIASTQGFFVRATATGTALTITESVKTIAGHYANFREEAPQGDIRVTLINEANSNNSDEALIAIRAGATDNYEDSFDADKMMNSGINIYSKSADGHKTAINTLSGDTARKTIPLTLKGTAGSYKMRISSTAYDKEILLLDKLTDSTIAIGSEGQIDVILANNSELADRYQIIIGKVKSAHANTPIVEKPIVVDTAVINIIDEIVQQPKTENTNIVIDEDEILHHVSTVSGTEVVNIEDSTEADTEKDEIISGIIVEDTKAEGTLSAHPNPISDHDLQLHIHVDITERIVIQIFNMMGVQVKEIELHAYAGDNLVVLPSKDFHIGQYWVKVEAQTWSRSLKVIKNHGHH